MDAKIIKQLENKEFVQKLLSMENENDVKKLFKDSGVEITGEDLAELAEILSGMAESMKNLSEDELKEIAGGKIPLSDQFRKWGESLKVDKGGTESERHAWYKGGWFRSYKVEGKPKTKGTPLGNFLYHHANELAITSMVGVLAAAGLGVTYAYKKGKQWYESRKK